MGTGVRACLRLRFLLAGLLVILLQVPAQAVVVLHGQIVDPRCGITGVAGTTYVGCSTFADTAGFQAVLNPGETAFVSATLKYEYSDEGLPLAVPFSIQLDPFGFSRRSTDHEIGLILPRSNRCEARMCGFPPNVDTGGVGFPPLVLGENDTADRLSGELSLSSFVAVASGSSIGYSTFVFVAWSGIAVSGVAAVPEASTWVLLALGLSVLALRHLRTLRQRWPGILLVLAACGASAQASAAASAIITINKRTSTVIDAGSNLPPSSAPFTDFYGVTLAFAQLFVGYIDGRQRNPFIEGGGASVFVSTVDDDHADLVTRSGRLFVSYANTLTQPVSISFDLLAFGAAYPVPEPGTASLLVVGLAGLACRGLRGLRIRAASARSRGPVRPGAVATRGASSTSRCGSRLSAARRANCATWSL